MLPIPSKLLEVRLVVLPSDMHFADLCMTAVNCLVDFLCVIIPISIIWRLQLKSCTQLGLILILLSCGVVTAACSIGRVVSLKDQVENDPTCESAKQTNPFHLSVNSITNTNQDDWVDQTYWQIAEQYGGIIFASLPAIRQLSAHWKQTHSLKASKSSKLYQSKNSTQKLLEPKDDYGNPRTPGRFSPSPKRFAQDYLELEEEQQRKGRQHSGAAVRSPRDKSLPPLPDNSDLNVKSGWDRSP